MIFFNQGVGMKVSEGKWFGPWASCIVTILIEALFSEIILNVDTCRYFDIPGIFFPVFQPVISIAKPGEIRKEYEEQLKKVCLDFLFFLKPIYISEISK